jgi:hypothetical protein
MDIATIILDLRTSPNLQEFINRRFNDPAKIVLERHDVAGVLMTTGGKFKLTRMIGNATHVTREVDLTDIRPDDIVLDIGACIGGFTVPAALRCAHVYAVEPLYTDELRENIAFNSLENVTVLEKAIAPTPGDRVTLTYAGTTKTVETVTFADLVRTMHPSFLKCDCEGGEWTIDPIDLADIRRIEMEIHHGDASFFPANPHLVPYLTYHWTTTIDRSADGRCEFVHAHPNRADD